MFKPLASILLLSLLAQAATVTYNWNVTYVTAAPDGFSRQVIGINGQWPCPPIEANVGDTVVVNLVNQLDNESTGLHFHGIDQKGTQYMDGPSGVTQCPIPSGSSFTYSFVVDQPGTYWYHSHNKGQYPDGLRGPLVVHDPNDPYAGQYDEEIVLTTSDWYHDTVPVLIPQFLTANNPHALPPFPDAILMNDTQNVQLLFTPGKTYKIRLISMAAFASTLLQFDSHTMRIIQVDGVYTQKRDSYQIRIAPAQRITFLLNAESTNNKNYAFTASLDMNRDYLNDPAPVYPFNITGYIVYDVKKPLPAPYIVNKWNSVGDDIALQALDGQAKLPAPTKQITLNFNFGLDQNSIPRAYFNNITYVPQKVNSLYTAISAGNDNTNPLIYGTVNPFVVEKGDIVQITVNNLDAAIHPFHLHGHQFQVMSKPKSGTGIYKGSGDSPNFPAIPMRRDTVAVNPGSYAVVRYTADNPGVWIFHCHIEWHVIMGLTATIIEAPEQLRGIAIPADHQAACAAQNIPIVGNAAGNSQNYTDLTGAPTQPPATDDGAIDARQVLEAGKGNIRISGRSY